MIKAHPTGADDPEMWISAARLRRAARSALWTAVRVAWFFTDGHGASRRWSCIAATTARASASRSRTRRSACGRSRRTRRRGAATSRLRASTRASFRDVGIRDALVPPDEAAAYPKMLCTARKIESMRRRAFVGSPDQVKETLNDLAARLGLDELVIVHGTYDAAPRHRSYELLAKAYGSIASSGVPHSWRVNKVRLILVQELRGAHEHVHQVRNARCRDRRRPALGRGHHA